MDLITQDLQIFTHLPPLAGGRAEIECHLEAGSLIDCALTLTHAAGRHAGGRLLDISLGHHRRLMELLDRHSAAARNNHEPR